MHWQFLCNFNLVEFAGFPTSSLRIYPQLIVCEDYDTKSIFFLGKCEEYGNVTSSSDKPRTRTYGIMKQALLSVSLHEVLKQLRFHQEYTEFSQTRQRKTCSAFCIKSV